MSTEFDDFVLSRMPTFIATSYEQMLNAETARDKLSHILHVFDLGMRTLTLGLINQYLVRDETTVSDPFLDELIEKKLPKASLDTWIELFFAALKVYGGNRDVFFIPELYDFYWDTTVVPHQRRTEVDIPFLRLTQIRNDFEHGEITDLHAIQEEAYSLLKQVLQSLSFISNYELLLVIGRNDSTFKFERHVGLEISVDVDSIPTSADLQPGWFYLSHNRNEFLQLDPLLIFWENVPALPADEDTNKSDTAIFHRFTTNQLQYMLAGVGAMIEDHEHVNAFIQFIETIRIVKRSLREIEQFTWWQLQEAAHKISSHRMATVQDKYNPQIYMQRNDVKSAFDNFLLSDKRAFVLLGKSGVGKSNFILSLKDEFQSHHQEVCILMYDAANMDPTIPITEFITQSFRDFYKFRDHGIDNIWHEIAGIDEIDRRTVLLCIDAINENHQPSLLLAQLNELAQSTWPWLKIVITSRPEAWNNIKRNIKLAEHLYYRDTRSSRLAVQMNDFTYSKRLDIFSQDELSQVYDNYQIAYRIQTPYDHLSEAMRQSLRDPLVLWLYASIYEGSSIPDSVTTHDVIPEYIQAMLRAKRIEQRDITFLQKTLMPIMINEERYSNSISEQDVENAGDNLFEQIHVTGTLSSGRRVNQSFTNLLDTEILVRKEEFQRFEIAFKFERFYDYFAGLQLQALFSNVVDRQQLFEQLLSNVETYPFLWGAVKHVLTNDISKDHELGITMTEIDDLFGRDLVRSALIDLGKTEASTVRNILLTVIEPIHEKSPLSRLISLLGKIFQVSINNEIKPSEASKLMCIKVASQLSMWETLGIAAIDPSANIRVGVVEEAYTLIQQKNMIAVACILDELESQNPITRIASFLRSIEIQMVITLLVIFECFEDKSIVEKMKGRMARFLRFVSIIAVNSENKIKYNMAKLVRSVLIWLFVRFSISAIKKVEGIVVVNLNDLELSFRRSRSDKEKIGQIMRYVNRDYKSIREMRVEMTDLATSRDLLALYATAVVFLARFISERDEAIELAKEVCHISASEDPATPIVTGVLLAFGDILNRHSYEFDAKMWDAYDGIFSKYQEDNNGIVAGFKTQYSWIPIDAHSYYYNLHIDKNISPQLKKYLTYLETNKKWKDFENFTSFLANSNIDHILSKASVLQLIGFLKHDNSSVREAAIRAIAQLRSYYPAEIDEILRESENSSGVTVLIQNYSVNQNMGVILTASLYRFWTHAVRQSDKRVLDYLQWVADYVSESNSLHQWLAGILNKLFDTILE